MRRFQHEFALTTTQSLVVVLAWHETTMAFKFRVVFQGFVQPDMLEMNINSVMDSSDHLSSQTSYKARVAMERRSVWKLYNNVYNTPPVCNVSRL